MYEKFLANSIQLNITEKGIKSCLFEKRNWFFFEGILSHISLLLWAFKSGNGNLNITVSRLALPVIIRNIFNQHKTLIVWHYFDTRDEKSSSLKIYYSILFGILKVLPKNKVGIITVAPYWEKYFRDEKNVKAVYYLPNCLKIDFYKSFISKEKKKLIHLGQNSSKNDPGIFELARLLKEKGYTCYFSTNIADEAGVEKHYTINYFNNFQDYIQMMAQSEYTLALTKFNEGWNRIAHESLLCGTHVIGYCRGGLGDLLTGSNSIIVNSCDEALYQIINKNKPKINYKYLDNFSEENVSDYLNPIINFLID